MDTKSFLLSKTVWGVLIGALPIILGLFGYSISDTGTFSAQSGEIVDSAISLFGAGLALYGRVKATTGLVVKK